MEHTLISFLGKGRKDEGGKYRTANYDFEGRVRTSQFFGLALNEVLKPDRLIVLGTSGSMWDIFYEKFADSEQQQAHWIALSDSAATNQTSQAQLDACAQDLTAKLGCECLLKLIPYGMNDEGQTEILQIMAEDIQYGDQVSLD